MRANGLTKRIEWLEAQKKTGNPEGVIIVFQMEQQEDLEARCQDAIAKGASTLILIPDNGRARRDPQVEQQDESVPRAV